ncbi:hypothetical protein [Anoxynatronum buryatiense]|uniref:Uncharacterized protein n=1 Tax=Anoxynatronum buryatiense TaxID=489973 RepID=A0AA45WYY3_9CLOT|nr:hypothetical protein [Anoxynatronum buryatiense]SMP70703.1 hypothetical protein SAMN06296020_1219 [Anoxynatronum buryatiense]
MGDEMKNISRKDFLKKMGTTVTGVALLGGMGSILTACSEEEMTEAAVQMGLDPEQVQYPVPYVRIDPDKAAERAYKYYKEKGG